MRFEAKYIGAQPGRQGTAVGQSGSAEDVLFAAFDELTMRLSRVLMNLDGVNMAPAYAQSLAARAELEKLKKSHAELSASVKALICQVDELKNTVSSLS